MEPQATDPVESETVTPVVASADDPATLIAAAEALTNPPEFAALSMLLGRIALAKLDPLPERQVIARIKSATGIGMSVLTQQLAELRRRMNATGDPHAPIPKPAWFRRLRLDFTGAPERNEANVIVALTSLSPLAYHYQDRAEIEAVVQGTARDIAFDTLTANIGTALATDRTLGGLCDWVEAEAPRPVDLPVVGAASLEAAVIPVFLHYTTADPLA